ncbi:MAG: hypothetical protein CM15mP25_3260 [Gammaproteobacteria bacterium]|nr:MAG: hypothetical protein CM15mP25_3260 [Gammaproteobacteria bacterium]
MSYIEFFFRYFHVLAGIVWIGMLYYFNFVQTEYFKEAEASAKSDAMAKLAPRALWWFRWGAMLTFLTGAYLFHKIGAFGMAMPAIWVGALAGTFMFLNVWLVIWPNQQIVLGMKRATALRPPLRRVWRAAPTPYFLAPCCSACWVPSISLQSQRRLAARCLIRDCSRQWASSLRSKSTHSSAAWAR